MGLQVPTLIADDEEHERRVLFGLYVLHHSRL